MLKNDRTLGSRIVSPSSRNVFLIGLLMLGTCTQAWAQDQSQQNQQVMPAPPLGDLNLSGQQAAPVQRLEPLVSPRVAAQRTAATQAAQEIRQDSQQAGQAVVQDSQQAGSAIPDPSSQNTVIQNTQQPTSPLAQALQENASTQPAQMLYPQQDVPQQNTDASAITMQAGPPAAAPLTPVSPQAAAAQNAPQQGNVPEQ